MSGSEKSSSSDLTGLHIKRRVDISGLACTRDTEANEGLLVALAVAIRIAEAIPEVGWTDQ